MRRMVILISVIWCLMMAIGSVEGDNMSGAVMFTIWPAFVIIGNVIGAERRREA